MPAAAYAEWREADRASESGGDPLATDSVDDGIRLRSRQGDMTLDAEPDLL